MANRRNPKASLAKAAGGWKEVVKFKDKNGNWVTRTIWGSGAAGFGVSRKSSSHYNKGR